MTPRITVEQIEQAWIEYHALPAVVAGSLATSERADELLEYLVELDSWVVNDPPRAWHAIREMGTHLPAGLARASLAAGPLEDFLRLHGVAHLDAVIEALERSPELRGMLADVWVGRLDDRVVDALSRFRNSDSGT